MNQPAVMPDRWSVIGDLERPDHYHLPPGPTCIFWGEYTPYKHTDGKGWNFSPTNQLISNFKKKMERRGQPDWSWKARAVATVGQAFAKMFNWNDPTLANAAFIPMPPSKARTDPNYDSRILDAVKMMAVASRRQLDIRDCLSFDGAHEASHETDDRPSPEQLYETLIFDPLQARIAAQPGIIFLVDDMLTTGAHFVAASRKLGEVFPGVQVVGVFVARRRVPNPFEEL